MENTTTVLFVAYNFPPHGGAGVQRSLKFVKYLPDFGWTPLVVTASSDATPIQDPSLLQDLPAALQVVRIPAFSIANLRAKAKPWKLSKAVTGLNLLLQIPDTARFWARKSQQVIDKLIEQEQPALIYTTSGPYGNHLAGLWAKQKWGIPWFADFRDPWSKNLLTPYLPGYRRLNRRIERSVLANADRVACVSESWLNNLYENLGRDREKFVVLENGYDDVDIRPIPPAQTDRFTLTHIGSFYRNRRPDPVIAAIRKLINDGRIPTDQLRVLFVGKNAHEVADIPPFEVQGYMPHQQLEQIRRESNALLLILATATNNIGNHSGKLFEYIASNIPILGIVPHNGVAQQLIEQTRTGIAVGSDIDDIANAIEVLYQQWRNGDTQWNPDWDMIQQYTRRNLTKRLAEHFNELIEV